MVTRNWSLQFRFLLKDRSLLAVLGTSRLESGKSSREDICQLCQGILHLYFLYGGSADSSIRIWEVGSRRLVSDLRAEESSPVFAVQWSRDGSRLASGHS